MIYELRNTQGSHENMEQIKDIVCVKYYSFYG